MDEFENLDGVAQAELVRRGDVKPQELAEAAIRRIENRDAPLNAVVTRAFDRGLDTAAAVDPTAPLAGVPFLIKDQLDWAGVRTTQGSRFLADYIPAADSPIVTRWLKAGVVPLGKTNVPECGLLATTEPEAYGPTNSPWDAARTVGGSSGGSAAAVASGMVPVASASDGGGSIRIPSAACGTFGLKTTRGRNPGAGWGGLSVTHVVSRTVRDSAAFLDASCGPELGDVTPLPRPDEAYLPLTERDPRKLRIAFSTDAWEGVRVAPEVMASVRRTAELLAELGHDVVEGKPAITPDHFAAFIPPMGVLVPAAIARSLDNFAQLTDKELTPDGFEPLTWSYAEAGHKVTGTDIIRALEAQAQLAAVVRPFFEDHDVWLQPTVAEVAPRNGEWKFPAHAPEHGYIRMTMFIPPLMTALANYTGQPAMSVPMENDEATGLPIASQFYGRWGDEATLLQLAAQLERARPWVGRYPSQP